MGFSISVTEFLSQLTDKFFAKNAIKITGKIYIRTGLKMTMISLYSIISDSKLNTVRTANCRNTA